MPWHLGGTKNGLGLVVAWRCIKGGLWRSAQVDFLGKKTCQFLRDLALVMPCHGSFDMKPQNVKIVEVSMGSTELRNCWLRTCQRHSLRKINMGIMSIDLCIFGDYNNQLFGSWDYNQLSSWTNISYHTHTTIFRRWLFKRFLKRFLCRRIVELCLHKVLWQLSSALRCRIPSFCLPYSVSRYRSDLRHWSHWSHWLKQFHCNHINRFQGIRRIELNWMASSIEVLERLYIDLWSTLLRALLVSRWFCFHKAFFAKVLVEKSLFGVLSSASSLLARRCSYGGIRQGVGFTPTYGLGMLGMLADYLIGLPSVVVGCLWDQETVIKDEDIVWKPFRTCTFQ